MPIAETKLIKLLKKRRGFFLREIVEELIPEPLKDALKKDGYQLKKAGLNALATSRVLRGSNAKRNVLDLLKLARKRKWGAVNDKLLTTVNNVVAQDVAEDLRDAGKKRRIVMRWIPSSSSNPDPNHEKNYGETFYLDKGVDGELPGERFGCQCGMEFVREE